MRFLATSLALCGALFLTTKANAQSAVSAGLDAQHRGDYAAAATLYQQACTDGDTRGCTGLGILFEEGRGGTKDETRAAELFQQACTGGDEAGCFGVGLFYEHGRGVAKDTARALQLYRQALTLNHDPAFAKTIQDSINDLSATQ